MSSAKARRAAGHPAPLPILVVGGTGQIGRELVRELGWLGPVHAPSRADLDLLNPDAVRSCVRALRPAIILNAAAYTAVEAAESQQATCFALNADAPGLLAAEASRLGAVLVHYSTDYVFDGRQDVAYTEQDAPRPLNAYGRSKLEGEQQVTAARGVHLILRTSWVYSHRPGNFVQTVLSRGEAGAPLRVVNDQRGTPNWARNIAIATSRMLSRVAPQGSGLVEGLAPVAGLYHLSAAGIATWYDLAVAALRERGLDRAARDVAAVTTLEYGSAVARPPFSVLSSRKAATVFGLEPGDWRDDLRAMLALPRADAGL